MRRDMDLARKILIQVADHESAAGWVPINIPDVPQETVSYHVKLLWQAGYLEADNDSQFGEFSWQALSLTWHGHEFIDAARNEGVWKKVKAQLTERGRKRTVRDDPATHDKVLGQPSRPRWCLTTLDVWGYAS